MAGTATPASRTALVAGGTGALGREIVSALQSADIAVAVHWRSNRDEAELLAAQHPSSFAVGANLTDADSVDALFASVESVAGAPSILVNTVHPSGLIPDDVASTPPRALERELDGLRIHHLLCSRAIPAMRADGYGRIVYIGGASTHRPVCGFGAFAATKAAASTLTRYIADECGRDGITANTIAPGRLVDSVDVLEEEHAAESERLLARTALGRFDTMREVASMVLALTTPGFSSVTGQTLWMAGGESL